MKYSIKKYITLLCFFGITFSYAQEKKVEKGNEEFNKYAFIDAREAYLKVAEDGYRDAGMLEKLGDSYYFTADYKNAAQWYGMLYDLPEDMEAEYLYRYALSLKSDEQYIASNKVMEEFLAKKGADYRAKLYNNERNYLEEIDAQSGGFELITIGFNSELSDFAPTFYKTDLVISSNRSKPGPSRLIHGWNDQPFLDFYIVATQEGGVAEGKKMSNDINTKYHESTSVFTEDGNTMYFTRNNYTDKEYQVDSNNINHLKLYRAKNMDGDWKVEELPFNSDSYSNAHPALSPDGKTLYFSSDRPGGKGRSDLYRVTITEDGFGTPESLGDGINTEGRDTFPFVSSKNRLYFASDGHVGLGGLDIFVTEIQDAGFDEVFNLGRPVNGPMDDFTFIVDETTGAGYFASNRAESTGDDDIYGFRRIKELMLDTSCTQNLEGQVLDKATNLALAGAVVKLLDDSGTILESTVSDSRGNFNFEVGCSQQLALRSSKENYTTEEKAFATNDKATTLKKTLFMSSGKDLGPTAAGLGSDLGKVLDLNPIYFDLDKSAVRSDAEIELRKVIVVMNTYPDMKIDVRSHTDSRGSDAYNLTLSQRRATATVNYLINEGGIDKNRLSGKGYGETKLTNNCTNGTQCSQAEHEFNRRSEFIIME